MCQESLLRIPDFCCFGGVWARHQFDLAFFPGTQLFQLHKGKSLLLCNRKVAGLATRLSLDIELSVINFVGNYCFYHRNNTIKINELEAVTLSISLLGYGHSVGEDGLDSSKRPHQYQYRQVRALTISNLHTHFIVFLLCFFCTSTNMTLLYCFGWNLFYFYI